MAQEQELSGPDLAQGIALADLADGGSLLGHAGGEAVLLVRSGVELFAVGAHCTHYHGPLAEGLVADDTIRCPWHHAAFDLRTGEAVRAPAFDPIGCWRVEQRDGKIFVTEKRRRRRSPRRARSSRARRRTGSRLSAAAPLGLPRPRCSDARDTKAASSC